MDGGDMAASDIYVSIFKNCGIFRATHERRQSTATTTKSDVFSAIRCDRQTTNGRNIQLRVLNFI